MLNQYKKSIFSFYLSDAKPTQKELAEALAVTNSFGGMVLCTDCHTPVAYAKQGERELILYGYAVDVFSGQSENLVETALESTRNLDEIIKFEEKLGGKYVIFYAENGKSYCLGDATCSVPIFYSVGLSSFVCCSNPNFISETFSVLPNDELMKIRKSGKLNQAMPFDVTVYREIKQLIPNHYIDIQREKAERIVNCSHRQTELSPCEAAKKTLPLNG